VNLYLPVVLLTLLFVQMAYHRAYATSLQENDYIIKDFGINNRKPFITVEGISRGSYDPSMGDEGYEAYVYDTDKGIYQVTVAQGVYSKEICLNTV
jgi:hypothetical protein